MSNKLIPTQPGTYLLNGQPVRVQMAWSRMALIVVDGPQAGTSVNLVKGEWKVMP